ncbi:MAG TPA: hypothetical protein VLA64_13505 [Azonexus sp.]|nr:hypothetical protein [Azonexus sp.]
MTAVIPRSTGKNAQFHCPPLATQNLDRIELHHSFGRKKAKDEGSEFDAMIEEEKRAHHGQRVVGGKK